MKGLFIPGITAEMFRNGCLESIETLMAEGEIYDIEYSRWIPCSERLPEEDGQYLITVKYKHVNDSYEDVYAEHGEWHDDECTPKREIELCLANIECLLNIALLDSDEHIEKLGGERELLVLMNGYLDLAYRLNGISPTGAEGSEE